MAITTRKLGINPQAASLLGLAIGVLLAMAIAAVIGYFLIFGGVRGTYLTIVTLALTVIAQHVAVGWSDVTGGDSGLIGVTPLSIRFVDFHYAVANPASFYLLVLALSARKSVVEGKGGSEGGDN